MSESVQKLEITPEIRDKVIGLVQSNKKVQKIFNLIVWSQRFYAVARRATHRVFSDIVDPVGAESGEELGKLMGALAMIAMQEGANPFSMSEMVHRLDTELVDTLHEEYRLFEEERQKRLAKAVGDYERYRRERPIKSMWVDLPRAKHTIWTGQDHIVPKVVREAVTTLVTAAPDEQTNESYTVVYLTTGEAEGLPNVPNLLVCKQNVWEGLNGNQQLLTNLLDHAQSRVGRPVDVVACDDVLLMCDDPRSPSLKRVHRASKDRGFQILAGLTADKVPDQISKVAKVTSLLVGNPEGNALPITLGFDGPGMFLPFAAPQSGLIL